MSYPLRHPRLDRRTLIRGCLGAFALGAPACAHPPWISPGSEWRRVRSRHFTLYTDTAPEHYEPLVDRLEDVHLALRQTFFPSVDTGRIRVIFFDDRGEFRSIAPPNTTGFALPTQTETSAQFTLLVFSRDADFGLVASVAAHEVAHAMLFALSDAVPEWLSEGFARYVEALDLADDTVIFDYVEIKGGAAPFPDPVPLERLLAARYRDFHGAGCLDNYMTAWLLVRMLLGRHAGSPARQLHQLVDALAGAESQGEVLATVEQAFGMPLERLEVMLRIEHARVVAGDDLPGGRDSLAKTLVRPPRPRPLVDAGGRETVRSLCRALRRRFHG